MSPHLDEDRCLDLLLGLLPGSEEEPLLRHVEECPPCEELMRGLGRDLERIRTLPVPSIMLERAAPAPRRTFWRLPSRRPLVIGSTAALAAAAAVVLLLLPRGGPAPFVPDETGFRLPAASDLLVPRGAGAEAEMERIAGGLAAYERGNYETAARMLAGEVADPQLDLLRRLYLSGALIHAGDPAGAAAFLRRIPASELPEPWRTEAAYALHRAWSMSGHAASADSLLRARGLPPRNPASP